MLQQTKNIFKFNKNGERILFSTNLKDEYIVQSVIHSKDFYEYEFLDFLNTITLGEGCVLDVGAHIGNHSLYFNKIMGKKVYAFEPNPVAYKELKINTKINDADINSFNVAVGAMSGKARINIEDQQNIGSANITRSKDGDIRLITLDEFVDEKNTKPVLIKVDVEGFEIEVLKGAEKTIKKFKPILALESLDYNQYAAKLKILEKFGYVPVIIFGATPMTVFMDSASMSVSDLIKSIRKNNDDLVRRSEHYRQVNQKYSILTKNVSQLKSELERNKSESDIKNQEIETLVAKLQDTQGQLNNVLRSKSFIIGNFIIRTMKRVYNHPILGYPMRFVRGLQKRNVRKIHDGNKSQFLEIFKPPKSKSFHLSKEVKVGRRKLTIAAVMDDFTYHSFRFDADILQLTPQNWKKEIENHELDMLFIESAWRGKDNLWWNTIPKACDELVEIIEYCRTKNIPTIFWNKEDPVHTATFMRTASLFDYVFTTADEAIKIYKEKLGHNRVYLLPFAAQPMLQNPIEEYDREMAVSFAGAYYKKYKERAKNFEELIFALAKKYKIVIYDRNFQKEVDDSQKFPEKYRQFIAGSLKFEEISKAYKGYEIAVNMNSIKDSSTMCARRVFELLASNTITVGNYSKAVRGFFGDLTISTDNGKFALKRLDTITSDRTMLAAHKLQALRKVLSEHTYADRLERITNKVFTTDIKRETTYTAVTLVKTKKEYDAVIKSIQNQKVSPKKIIVISDALHEKNHSKIIYISQNESKKTVLGEYGDAVICFKPEHYYGKFFASDLLDAMKYFDGDAIGKSAHLSSDKNNNLTFKNPKKEYKRNVKLIDGSILFTSRSSKETIYDVYSIDSKSIKKMKTLSVDRFNFIPKRNSIDEKLERIIEADTVTEKGINIDDMFRISDPIKVGEQAMSPSKSRDRYLVLTNIYPSYDDLYRNGFVHARVRAYRSEGLSVDVAKVAPHYKSQLTEFENIDVTQGDKHTLREMLETGKYKKILVHFLDEYMWSVIKDFIGDIEVYVWVHGAEVQHWKRRDYNYSNSTEKKEAIKLSNKRAKFWRSLLKQPHSNLHLIFVSKYFADEVLGDLGIDLASKYYSIIHNFIDTEIFNYEEKEIEQRKRVLSIRPFASNKYANDLSVKAVLSLSKKDIFKDLHFTFIGDGELFDSTLEPIKRFKNVKIERKFLTQSEIANLHKENGLFLVPTRMDAQGVSRDEAMSSGLVPLTNKVAAIPEFVDDDCGILDKPDSYKKFVTGIEELYNNPELFKKLSKNAAKRVRNQSDYNHTVNKEINLIVRRKDENSNSTRDTTRNN